MLVQRLLKNPTMVASNHGPSKMMDPNTATALGTKLSIRDRQQRDDEPDHQAHDQHRTAQEQDHDDGLGCDLDDGVVTHRVT